MKVSSYNSEDQFTSFKLSDWLPNVAFFRENPTPELWIAYLKSFDFEFMIAAVDKIGGKMISLLNH